VNSPALRVPRARGELTRRLLLELNLLRTDLAIWSGQDYLLLPLRSGTALPAGLGEVVEAEFAERQVTVHRSYHDLLAWTPEEKSELPRSFDVVGDIVLVRIPAGLEPKRFEIGEALLRFVPRARLVGVDRGVSGPERRRRVERIAGSGSWATRHRENEIELEVDVEKAYFSPRLAREHARVSSAVAPGESVFDLCCGVGPFSVAIALGGHASLVTAVDMNPEAIQLLQLTVDRYRLRDRVRCVNASLEDFVTGQTPASRVIFNLPREGIKYLGLVATLVAPGGQLHYYEIVPREQIVQRGDVLESRLPDRHSWQLVERHVVHPYSPGTDLVAFLFERLRGGAHHA
jgi:tRNA (guanine37-N1)-methyltransferase